MRAVVLGVNNNDNFNINTYNNINNNRPAFGIAPKLLQDTLKMKTYKNLYKKLYSMQNLQNAYEKAKKHKTNTPAVKRFEKHHQLYLIKINKELKNKKYKPQPLKKFILRDPKTRTICVSEFRDRIVHHALINILQPIFEPRFIHDSYASRKNKGTLPAIKRFDRFLKKTTKNGKTIPNAKNNNQVKGYVLKADIKHYFETVDQQILMNIIAKRIKDNNILWLTKEILNNYNSTTPKKGMPLGNWTSQFFANIYLNELDQYLKHKLKIKHYIRYVDDFVILHPNKTILIQYETQIKKNLCTLKLELHPDKCKIIPLEKGLSFLGYRIFYKHKLIKQRNIRKIHKKLNQMLKLYKNKKITAENIQETLNGWNAYASTANTYKLRQKLNKQVNEIISSSFQCSFNG